MVFYFSSISIIENLYLREHNVDTFDNIIPIFFNCITNYELKITHCNQDSIIELITRNNLEIESFKELEIYLDLIVLINTDFYLESCQLTSVI